MFSEGKLRKHSRVVIVGEVFTSGYYGLFYAHVYAFLESGCKFCHRLLTSLSDLGQSSQSVVTFLGICSTFSLGLSLDSVGCQNLRVESPLESGASTRPLMTTTA